MSLRPSFMSFLVRFQTVTGAGFYGLAGLAGLAGMVLMAGSALLYSLGPLLIHLGGGAAASLVFSGLRRVGSAAAVGLGLLFWFSRELRTPGLWAAVWAQSRTWAAAGVLFSMMDKVFYAGSMNFLDVSVAPVLVATWPMGVVFLLARLYPHRRIRLPVPAVAGLLALAGAGVALVVASESGGLRFAIAPDGGGLWRLLAGVSVTQVASATVVCSVLTILWGEGLARRLMRSTPTGGGGAEVSSLRLRLFGVVLGTFLGQSAAAVLSLAIGAAMGKSLPSPLSPAGYWPLAGGFLVTAPAFFLLQAANLLTRSVAVNALGYLIPALALVRLALLGLVGVVRPAWLVAGTALVIAVNLALNLGPLLWDAGRAAPRPDGAAVGWDCG